MNIHEEFLLCQSIRSTMAHGMFFHKALLGGWMLLIILIGVALMWWLNGGL